MPETRHFMRGRLPSTLVSGQLTAVLGLEVEETAWWRMQGRVVQDLGEGERSGQRVAAISQKGAQWLGF